MIQIKNLTKNYGETVIFDNMSFDFPNKGLICLLGASGSGKSTLLNILAGFDSIYDGDISVGDISISRMKADELCVYRRDNIGFVFQNYHLLSGYTVLENILLSSELHPLGKVEYINKAKSLLDQLGLSSKANEKIENLSGGQKQRVAIARALISNPSIILADEPTGALDRSNATEIMKLLKEISKDCLVVVITHDQKICDFADEIISIEHGKIVADNKAIKCTEKSENKVTFNPIVKVSAFKRGLKNFKVHFMRYMLVSLTISIGILAFMLSLSSGNILEQSITDFKEKNTAFNNGYIKGEDAETVFKLLQSDQRIENVYYQYKIENVSLNIGNKSETMMEKYPMPKATESMSYGNIPKKGINEISLTPSLAAKFDKNIKSLIGQTLTLKYDGKEYKLTVSGIFNAGYDDFIVSSDIEQEFYKNRKDDTSYSISYDVKSFDHIVSVSEKLKAKAIDSKNVSSEVAALQSTFNNLNRLFLIVSILIFAIGLFISIILLVKLQNSRYRELGLLSALGFSKGAIRRILLNENVLLSGMAAVFNAVLIGCTYVVSSAFDFSVDITIFQMLSSIFATAIVVIVISIIVSYKLIHTEPAEALRK
ncbi:ABC transporter ATP-binding protein/permease [Bacillus toyonensis]|uniref:ABC transporter ATP-binding protein/permease n=1 Tax=Bacillus toyonensis TaxID=155322 RepID=UPI003304766E|nr:ATP-binding cassette domain-containing protein [Bacillus toyonensis]